MKKTNSKRLQKRFKRENRFKSKTHWRCSCGEMHLNGYRCPYPRKDAHPLDIPFPFFY